MKKFIAKIKNNSKTNTMLVSEKDEKLAINDIANYYFNLFENQNNNIEF